MVMVLLAMQMEIIYVLVINKGIKIQYGICGNNGTSTQTFTFPTAFQSLKYSCTISDWNNTQGVYYVGVAYSSRTKTQITVVSANNARGFGYIAIGY